MSTSSQAQLRTRSFARVIGPVLTAMAVIAAARSSAMATLLAQFTASQVWSWVVGAFVLIGGVAIVAFHQYWRNPAAVIISVLGWLLVVRGVLLMAFPAVFAAVADRMITVVPAWQAIYVVMVVLGLYLTYVGWKPHTPMHAKRTDQAPPSAGAMPRAA